MTSLKPQHSRIARHVGGWQGEGWQDPVEIVVMHAQEGGRRDYGDSSLLRLLNPDPQVAGIEGSGPTRCNGLGLKPSLEFRADHGFDPGHPRHASLEVRGAAPPHRQPADQKASDIPHRLSMSAGQADPSDDVAQPHGAWSPIGSYGASRTGSDGPAVSMRQARAENSMRARASVTVIQPASKPSP